MTRSESDTIVTKIGAGTDAVKRYAWDAAPPALTTELPMWNGGNICHVSVAEAGSLPPWTGAPSVYNTPPQWNPLPAVASPSNVLPPVVKAVKACFAFGIFLGILASNSVGLA